MWASIGGAKEEDLASQSKNKFIQYYRGASEVSVTSLEDLSRDKTLEENEILFFNWSKIKAQNKEDRKLRKDSEQEVTWDGMLERTHEQHRPIILIIDESHTGSSTALAEEEINLINPKIVIHVTATHRDTSDIDVKVEHTDVVNAGLIKESIKSQTKEDFKDKKAKDLDVYLLQLAIKKRQDLENLYKKINVDVNPLLMIQLPNDDKTNHKGSQKKEIVLKNLKKEGIEENFIAIWLNKEKIRLENITINNNEIKVLLFKQAPATGWDCTRAQVLLMYRETKSPIFQTQVLGRILRMPEGKHYLDSTLNNSYLYTTYTKNEIIESYNNFQGENDPAIYEAVVKKNITQIKLKTFVSQRIKYGDLGKTFQFTFLDVANKEFNKHKLFQRCLDLNENVELDLIVDYKIRDCDGFVKKNKKSRHTRSGNVSS